MRAIIQRFLPPRNGLALGGGPVVIASVGVQQLVVVRKATRGCPLVEKRRIVVSYCDTLSLTPIVFTAVLRARTTAALLTVI